MFVCFQRLNSSIALLGKIKKLGNAINQQSDCRQPGAMDYSSGTSSSSTFERHTNELYGYVCNSELVSKTAVRLAIFTYIVLTFASMFIDTTHYYDITGKPRSY